MSNDDLLKGLEKDVKKIIETGLQEESRCECGYEFKDVLRRLHNDPTIECPRCGLKTRVSVKVKERP